MLLHCARERVVRIFNINLKRSPRWMTGGKRKRRIILDISFFVLRHSIVACFFFSFNHLLFPDWICINNRRNSYRGLSRKSKKENRVALSLFLSSILSLLSSLLTPLSSLPSYSPPYLAIFVRQRFFLRLGQLNDIYCALVIIKYMYM